MELRIMIHTDNAAFDSDEKCGEEMARILRECAERLENKNRRAISRSNMKLLDVNGNTCGLMEAYSSLEEDKAFTKSVNDRTRGK